MKHTKDKKTNKVKKKKKSRGFATGMLDKSFI